jgi:uncharacterized membrane protein HdeD (DUF308 family)
MSDLSDVLRLPGRVGTGWGFAVMLLGVLAVSTPFISGMAASSFVAVLIVAAGLAMTMYAFKASSIGKGLMQLLFGGITVVCGAAMFMAPILNMFALTGVLMVYFVVDGIVSIYSGIKGRSEHGWGWVTISGVASVALAVLLYRQWPDSGAYAVGLLVGIRLIFSGWSIAMLGMLGDATVDVAEAVVEEAVQQSDNA